MSPRNTAERVLAVYVPHLPDDVCWPWQSTITSHGYGQVFIDGKTRVAHRYVYELLVGEIPEGLQLDHRCHDWRECTVVADCPHRRCVNPRHLDPVTPAENNARSGSPATLGSLRTHCPRGHEYHYSESGRQRRCRTCEAAAGRRARNGSDYIDIPTACGYCRAGLDQSNRSAGRPRHFCDQTCYERHRREAERAR